MNVATLTQLRKTHSAWRLLCADNAPLVVSFLYHAFIEPNVRSLLQSQLTLQLEDFLYRLRQEAQDEEAFPKSAYAYLEDWAQNFSTLVEADTGAQLDVSALFDEVFVDEGQLKAHVSHRWQVNLRLEQERIALQTVAATLEQLMKTLG